MKWDSKHEENFHTNLADNMRGALNDHCGLGEVDVAIET